MNFCWAGAVLRVDLTNGTFETDPTARYSEKYLGGKGINAKILWDEVPPEIGPLDPENRLIFGAGPLVGTKVPGSCRASITSKSPLSGFLGDSSLGGYIAPELKFAGYDHIVILGQSEKPVYLWINDGKVELRNAVHLWGRDTIETEVLIKEELGNRVQIACIGPAGENMVFSASINHGLGDVAARTGMGAVMGSKNLKAIVVRGSGDLNMAHPAELNDLYAEIIAAIPRPIRKNENFKQSLEPGEVVYGNHDQTVIPEFIENYERLQLEFYEKRRDRDITCFNCPQACKNLISCPDSDEKVVLKCENKSEWLLRLKECDPAFVPKAASLCHRFGLDMMSTTSQIAFLMDLYEKGIVNDRDTDGIAMEWKNHEAVYAMIEKIAMREGCGELFTEGIVKAADKIGKGADRYALHVKGLELPLLSHYYIDNALGAAISERGDSFRITSATVMLTLNTLPSVLPQKAIEGLIRKNFLPHSWDTMRDRHEYKGKGSLLAYHAREVAHIPDLLGICKFLVGWVPFFCYFKSDTMAKCLSLATGKDFDNEKLNSYCERMTDLIRAFNAREGITSKDDTVPDILFEEPSLVTGKPLDREKFNGMLGEVYSARGWNKNGMPTRERLEELGMKDVADDLDNRGLMLKKGR